MKRTLFAMPTGHVQMLCLTTSQTERAPVKKPKTSVWENGRTPDNEPPTSARDAARQASTSDRRSGERP